MSETDTDTKANQPIVSNDQSNLKAPPDGVHVYISVIDETSINMAKLYVDVEMAKENPCLQCRFLIKKGTILPGWLLEGLDNPPIEYFEGMHDFKAALDRLLGEELIKDIADGNALKVIR